MKNTLSLLAPNSTPFGDVVFDELAPAVKSNPPRDKAKAIDRSLLFPLTAAVFDLGSQGAPLTREDIAPLVRALETFLDKVNDQTGDKGGVSWKRAANKTLDWIKAGMPVDRAGTRFNAANKSLGWSVFARGNSKLPYLAFSSLPGVTCPGAGECLLGAGKKNTKGKLDGGWCYSFKAWRYPDAFFRQLGNTLLLRSATGQAFIGHCFDLWARSEALIKGGETVRIYVDGDMASLDNLRFWMDCCHRHPHVKAYGYSKSWPIFLRYEQLGYKWPANYSLNLSEGSRYWSMPDMIDKMRRLPITRDQFAVVNIPKAKTGKKLKSGKDAVGKIAQNYIDMDRNSRTGVYAAVERLKHRIGMTTDAAEKNELQLILSDWVGYVKELEADKKLKTVPDEFWSRNPAYTAAVEKAARVKYPSVEYDRAGGGRGLRDKFFICPGKCGNCLGNGRHACGDLRLKVPIVIGIH